jgi:NO-binding membrane sensor protein with MHYT domain
MPVTHQHWLVVLSLLVAVQGAYVGLGFAIQVGEAAGVRRRILLAGAALSLATAIWAMHFVGMLAARLPFPVDYLVLPTLLSFLVCVIVVGAAVFAATAAPLTRVRLVTSACLMGGGIFTMHYIGMSALHGSAHMVHAPVYVAASLVVAIAAAGLALWLAAGRGGRPPLILSATAFGIAVSGMHYTAMAGMTIFPHEPVNSAAPALSTELLAIVVAVVAFCVSGMFLLILVPDRVAPAVNSAGQPTAAATAIGATPPSPLPTSLDIDTPGHAELGQGTYSPLGGAGSPPKRAARHLPVERDGMTVFVPVEDVFAVHANAHYTYIFDGTTKLFCPLAIGIVESRLDRGRFIRVHRSHIVNLDRVVGIKRTGDGGIVELAAADHYSVPVARSRVSSLKSRMGLKSQAAAT